MSPQAHSSLHWSYCSLEATSSTFNTFCELMHPSTWSRWFPRIHIWYAHYFSQGDACTFTVHPSTSTHSPFCYSYSSLQTHLIHTLPRILNTKYFQQDCDAENIWSMGNSQRWYTQKRSLDPSQTEIMTNIHLDVRGGKWEGHKTTRAYDILWCGVCVMRCWSNT